MKKLVSFLALVSIAACGDVSDPDTNTDTLGLTCTSNDDCNAEQYCLLRSDSCDGASAFGESTCELRGRGEPAPEAAEPPVCGCDGEVYASLWEASTAGVNVAKNTNSCAAPPANTRTCGALFCELDTYCRDIFEGWLACEPLPDQPGCATDRTCDTCFPDEALPSNCARCDDAASLTLECGTF